MKKDLYQTLKVPKNADKKAIKKAYRKLAKEHHTDKGGDLEDFLRVQLAYSVLIDDVKRERYDITGESEKPSENKAEQIFMQIVLKSIDEQLPNPLQAAVNQISRDYAQVCEDIKSMERRRAHFLKWSKRIRRKSEGNNLLTAAILHQAETVEKAIALAKESLELLTQALKIAEHYECDSESPDRNLIDSLLSAGFLIQPYETKTTY